MTTYFDDAGRDEEWRRAVGRFDPAPLEIPTSDERTRQLIYLHYIDSYIAALDRRMQLAREGIIPYGERE